MKVLFVCRHNRFRSKAGEALLKKYIGKDKGIEVKSAGVKLDLMYVADSVKRELMRYGVDDVDNTPRLINKEVIDWADKIVIVADNVLLDGFPKKKLEVWKVRDCDQSDEECIMFKVEEINNRVKELIDRLKIKEHQ